MRLVGSAGKVLVPVVKITHVTVCIRYEKRMCIPIQVYTHTCAVSCIFKDELAQLHVYLNRVESLS